MTQSTPNNKYPSPFSMRLSVDERTEIESRASAAGLSIGGYCKSVILEKAPPRASRRPPLEMQELAKLIGQVSRVGSNLNQIAKQLNSHSSIELPELQSALDDLSEIRAVVMMVLGYSENYPDTGVKRHDH